MAKLSSVSIFPLYLCVFPLWFAVKCRKCQWIDFLARPFIRFSADSKQISSLTDEPWQFYDILDMSGSWLCHAGSPEGWIETNSSIVFENYFHLKYLSWMVFKQKRINNLSFQILWKWSAFSTFKLKCFSSPCPRISSCNICGILSVYSRNLSYLLLLS